MEGRETWMVRVALVDWSIGRGKTESRGGKAACQWAEMT